MRNDNRRRQILNKYQFKNRIFFHEKIKRKKTYLTKFSAKLR